MTALLERPYTEQEETLSSQQTFEAVRMRLEAYRPEQTEAELGLTYTELDQLPGTGRHAVLALDETVQPGNNFKSNGMRWKVRQLMRDRPDLTSLHIGSAGNAGAALVSAAADVGLRVTVETPASLVASKRALLDTPWSSVHAVHRSVEEATAAAYARAADNPRAAYVHPYDDIDAIAGQGMVGLRALKSLFDRQAAGQFDLQCDNVTFLVQRGGGSLLTGIACAVYAMKQRGLLGDNVTMHEVRPSESLARYDGLHVARPGEYAQSVLEDPAFVQGAVAVDDEDTGRAAQLLRQAYGHRRVFEPSGMAGLAAFQKLRAGTAEPTVFVTVLSGANASAEIFQDFADMPYRRGQERLSQLGRRTLEQLLDQPYVAADSRMKLFDHPYGRPQTATT